MQKKILILLSLFTVLGLTIGSLAQKTVKMRQRYQTPEGGDKWAVIIGVNDYNPPITDLRFAVADAESLYSTLTDPEIGGFESDRVMLLTDTSANPPTRDNILLALTKPRRQRNGDRHGLCLLLRTWHRRERHELLPAKNDQH